jgi:Fe-S-cluster containining protein
MHSNSVKKKNIFNCTQCGECCKGYGGTFVTNEDIKKIAQLLNISPKKVLSDYCQVSGDRPVLAIGRNGYCVFWNKICTIHSIKPRMCRAWPFIESVLKDSANWRAMASCCPGIEPDAKERQIRAEVLYHLDNMKNNSS